MISFDSTVQRPAHEWSRGDASEIDGQIERSNGAFGKSDIERKTAREAASELGKERVSNERERMSQNFRSWLHRLVRAHGYHGAASVICEIAHRKIGRAAGMDRPSPIFP